MICLPSRRQLTKSINALSILTQLKEDFMQKNIKKTTKQDVQNSPIVQANYNVLGIEFVSKDDLVSKDDQPMVSSVQVAKHFGKQHKNVIRAIEQLEIPKEFNRLNFEPVEYEDKKGEKRPAYLMTRDGFLYL